MREYCPSWGAPARPPQHCMCRARCARSESAIAAHETDESAIAAHAIRMSGRLFPIQLELPSARDDVVLYRTTMFDEPELTALNAAPDTLLDMDATSCILTLGLPPKKT